MVLQTQTPQIADRIRQAVVAYIENGVELPEVAFCDAATFHLKAALEHCLCTMAMNDEQLVRTNHIEALAEEHIWIPTAAGRMGDTHYAAPMVGLNIAPAPGFYREYRRTQAQYHGTYDIG